MILGDIIAQRVMEESEMQKLIMILFWAAASAAGIALITLPVSLDTQLVAGISVLLAMMILKLLRPDGIWRLVALAFGTAIVLRFVFIFAGAALISRFAWILLVFGGFLVYSGAKMFLNRNKKEEINALEHPVVKFMQKRLHLGPLVMTVVFMLFEVRHVPYKLRFALNNPQIHIAGLHRALKGVSHYLALKTLLSLWTGVIIWLGLMLMGVQFALMWGVLAFLLNYVPNIGSVISAVPPMIQALLFNGYYECLLVGALFLVVHMIIGNILEPRMMGHRLGMSTLVVFLSLLVWGWLLGPVGMLLSVPLTSVCKIWMETTRGGSKLAILLGPGRPKSRLPG